MNVPAIGTRVEVVLNVSVPDLRTGRRETTETIAGTVVATPKWMTQHSDLTLFNERDKINNYISMHRIVSISGVKVEQPKVTADVVLTVYSSKTGEPYNVRMDGRTKRWSCTCTGFQFHKKCRHATRAAEAA